MSVKKPKSYPSQDEIAEALREPFPSSEIKWMQQTAGVTEGKGGHEDGVWCLATAYLDARAVQKRLDDVFGIFGWKDEYVWKGDGKDGGIVCRLSVKWGDEWVTKEDGAPATHIEAFKGGISDALKRAAARFGVGRYLYYVDSMFADATFTRPKGSRAKAKAEGWREGKTDGKKFYWQTPKLPNWALPKDEQDKTDETDESNLSPAKNGKPMPRLARTDVIKEVYGKMEAKGLSEEEQNALVFIATGLNSRRNITEEMIPLIEKGISEWNENEKKENE